ncbi:MAG: hypothetical protein KGO22_18235, partial [Gammaproteobacteria bacterium]|nr:hypothetical protein [Gammaproteobacteria bacterium]
MARQAARRRPSNTSGRSPAFSAARQIVFGCAAAAMTYGVGRLLGVTLSWTPSSPPERSRLLVEVDDH